MSVPVLLTGARDCVQSVLTRYARKTINYVVPFRTRVLDSMPKTDEFIVETVVSSNEMLSDDSALARPFGEASYSAVVAAKEHSGGLHNAYVAVGTFATAIVIVVAVVSSMQKCLL